MKERVLITDSLDPASVELLEEGGFEAFERPGLTGDELLAAARDAVGWIVRSGTTITRELIEAAPSLRVIGRAGVGVDNIDIEAATRRGVVVINAPEGNTISTAEHACAMILALARQIPAADRSIRDGAWDRKRFVGKELYGKTLGVVGAGKVGRAVAERMSGFGMRVLGTDPLVSDEVAKESNIQLVDFDALVETSDVISLHAPLTDATRLLFGAEVFARCQVGVLVVNCARGGLVDETALLAALESGRVGGAALDVFAQEPPVASFTPVLRHPNVICTPHIAASTAEAQKKVAAQVTEQVVRGLRGESVSTTVNAAAVRLSSRPDVRPFVELAIVLGRIAAKLSSPHPIRRVTVTGAGDVPKAAREVLPVAALAGVLGELHDIRVNLVNATALAEEAGLPVHHDWTSASETYQHHVSVEVEADSGWGAIRGALFARDEPRIIGVGEYELEVRPAGAMLFYRNIDRPGMLASVGAIVARAGVNIGSMALGRRGAGESALTVMHLDEPLGPSDIAAIQAVEGLSGVRQIAI